MSRNFITALQLFLMVGAVVLAWHNLRSGRCDRRGAFRFAGYVFSIEMMIWLVHSRHFPSRFESAVLYMGIAQALFGTGKLWLWYVALEPFVRKIWPKILISWTRLLDGRFRDPLVGRDLILGVLAGTVASILMKINILAHTWAGLPKPALLDTNPLSLLGPAEVVGAALQHHLGGLNVAIFLMLTLLLFRILLRSERRAAIGVFFVVTSFVILIGRSNLVVSWLPNGLLGALTVWLLVRFGLLTVVTYSTVTLVAWWFPLTTDAEQWFFGNGMFAIGVFATIAVYGYYYSIGGRNTFRDVLPQQK